MHKALYREYRPQKFEDIIGQEHIVKTLKNQINENTLGHAYLFCGTRGTGKTSTAKIFSRAVNCTDENKDNIPCNECESCKSISENSTLDVVEIDAASNNSVDDIREIRESVKYPPTNMKYKVYIIDEVHMLSAGAFNALLKTLEEPPSYVIFILATTDPNKIPATILSRCQRYDFKNVSVKDIRKRLEKVCDDLEFKYDENALNLIARNAQGALRDSLSILEQCMSFVENNVITYNDVIEVLGTANPDQILAFCLSIIKNDSNKALTMLDEFILWGRDIKTLIDEMIYFYRNMMIIKVSREPGDLVQIPEHLIEDIKAGVDSIEMDTIIRNINILSELGSNIRNASNPRVAMEIAIIKMSQPSFDNNTESISERIKYLEKLVENGKIIVKNAEIVEGAKLYPQGEDMSYHSGTLPAGSPVSEVEKIKEEAEKEFPGMEKVDKERTEELKSKINEFRTVLEKSLDEAFKYAVNPEHAEEMKKYLEPKIPTIFTTDKIWGNEFYFVEDVFYIVLKEKFIFDKKYEFEGDYGSCHDDNILCFEPMAWINNVLKNELDIDFTVIIINRDFIKESIPDKKDAKISENVEKLMTKYTNLFKSE